MTNRWLPKVVMSWQAKICFSLAIYPLFALISVSTALAQSCNSNDAVARMVSVQGQVSVNQTGARQETLICRGDIVTVGPFSRAAIQLIKTETTLRIEQETRFRVLEPPAERESLLDLLKGALYIFSREPRRLEIYTPFVNAAIEGTEFLVRVAEDRTFVTVYEGRVLAANDKGQVRVGSAQSAVALQGQAPRLIEVITPEDAVQWALYYRPILEALYDPSAASPALARFVGDVDYRNIAGVLRTLDGVPQSARDEAFFVYRAAVLQAVGRVELAQDDLASARQLNPTNGDVIALSAIIAVTQNDNEQALQLARQAVEQAPESAAARLALSYALQARFDLDGALTAVEAAIERNPDNALAYARLSELWLSKGELDESLKAANQAVALNSNIAHTQTVLGFANLSRIDIDAAMSAFGNAIELDQAAPLPRLGLGLAKIRKGQLEAGRKDIEVAVSLDPLNSLFRSYLGKAYFEEKRDVLSGTQLELAKQLDPLDPTPWLYDAIRKQTENRPVEALEDLQESIDLNDNRAVYRSRLLLDQDLAARAISLSRIYDDLGFDQTALVEGTESLAIDPANFSAHRFLSDTYAALPRHEIARTSELLQSQLLQPINSYPVQPQIAETDLNIITTIGPTNVNFNEFTSLFEQDGYQVNLTGLIGNNDTWSDEVVLSGMEERFSYSVGQFYYKTDGFRVNNDLRHEIYNAFAQMSLTDKLDVQFEYRRRETEQGDLRVNFDPDDFSVFERNEVKENKTRLGLHFEPSPQSDLIMSIIHIDGEMKLTDIDRGVSLDSEGEDETYDGQAQYLFKTDQFNIITGLGLSDIDVDLRISQDFTDAFGEPCPSFPPLFGICDFFPDSSVDQYNAYLYVNGDWQTKAIWTLGIGYDSFEQGQLSKKRFNPKAGLRWSLTDNISLRLAYLKTIKRALVANQTLEPTQVAGFNQFFDDVNGSLTERYGVGVDAALSEDVNSGLEFSRRNLKVPAANIVSEEVSFENEREDFYRAYLYFMPSTEWVVTAEAFYEQFEREETQGFSSLPNRLTTTTVPLAVQYFNPKGFFAKLGTTYVNQNIDFSAGSTFNKDNTDFWLFDAALGYRLPKRRGLLSLEVKNLFDENFLFQDINIQRQEPSNPRFIPERLITAWITLNF